MSIINNVLNELENKPSAFTPLEFENVQAKNNHRLQHIYTLVTVLLLFAVVVYCVIVYFPKELGNVISVKPLRQSQAVSRPIDKSMHNSLDEPENIPVSASDSGSHREQNGITGLQIRESTSYLEMSLQLSAGTRSLLKESARNRYTFFIPETAKKIIAPQIQDNNWLKNIEVKEVKGGFDIQFTTVDKVLIETHHSRNNNQFFWIIRFKKAQPARDSATQKKTPLIEQADLNTAQHSQLKDKNNNTKLQLPDPVPQVMMKINPVKKKPTGEQILREAQLALQRQDWQKARSNLHSLMGSQLDKKARGLLLTLLKRRHKQAEMKALLDKSLALYPQEADFLVMDADLLFAEKRFLDLIDRYRNNTRNKTMINFVAASFLRTAQYQNAIDYFQQSIKIDPQQPRQWVSLAISEENVSHFERAGQAYKMALNSGPVNDRLRLYVEKRIQQLSENTKLNR